MLIPVSGLYVQYNLIIYNSELIFYVISAVSLVIKREYIDEFDCSNSMKYVQIHTTVKKLCQ